MYISSRTTGAASENAAASQAQARQVSSTRAAVEAQLAQNRANAKSNSEKLDKVTNPQAVESTSAPAPKTTVSTQAAAAAAAPASTAKPADAGKAAAQQAATAGTTAKTAEKSNHSDVFAKQKAHNEAQAKINAALLSKFSTPETNAAKTAPVTTNSAAEAATAKYMANSGTESSTSQTVLTA